VYLCDTGADFLLLDGFTSQGEAGLVLRLARNAGDAPVLAALQVDARGGTPDGRLMIDAARELLDAGCGAIGMVCDAAAADLAPLAEPLLALDAPIAVFLGAVAPALLAPGAYAARMAPLARLPVAILGGGRHIGPAHIAALASALGYLHAPMSIGEHG
jgi:methionine synthase I (cobalamin-dependent)